MDLHEILSKRTVLNEVSEANLANLLSLTALTTKGDRDDAADDFVAAIRALRTTSGNLTAVRQVVALADWQLRLTCDYKGKDGVTRPDYNGKSATYKNLRDRMLTKAGLDVTARTTPFEAAQIKVARDNYLAVTRYEVRKIADDVLSVADLKGAGFKPTSQLPSDQKLGKPVKVERVRPIEALLDDLQANISAALSRKGDVRSMPAPDRAKRLARLTKTMPALVKALAPTASEKDASAAQDAAVNSGAATVASSQS